MGITVGNQFIHRFCRVQFYHTFLFETAHDHAGSVGFPDFHAGKCLRHFFVNGFDGQGSGIIVGSPEVNHEDRYFVIRTESLEYVGMFETTATMGERECIC